MPSRASGPARPILLLPGASAAMRRGEKCGSTGSVGPRLLGYDTRAASYRCSVQPSASLDASLLGTCCSSLSCIGAAGRKAYDNRVVRSSAIAGIVSTICVGTTPARRTSSAGPTWLRSTHHLTAPQRTPRGAHRRRTFRFTQLTTEFFSVTLARRDSRRLSLRLFLLQPPWLAVVLAYWTHFDHCVVAPP